MLAVFQSLFHIFIVGIVRRCYVDYIHIFVGEHLVDFIIDFFDTILFGKFNSFFSRPVCKGIKRVLPIFSRPYAISFAITPQPITAQFSSFFSIQSSPVLQFQAFARLISLR